MEVGGMEALEKRAHCGFIETVTFWKRESERVLLFISFSLRSDELCNERRC
jgi:hypothetical protein